MLRDDEARSRRRRRQTCRERPLLDAQPAERVPLAVPERDRRQDLAPSPVRAGPRHLVDDVVGSAAHEEARSVGRERQPAEAVRHADDLHLARRSVRHVVDEDVLARRGIDALAVLVEHAVVTGREDQQGRAVRRESGRDGPARAKGRCNREVRVEAEEHGARRCVRRQRGPVRQAEDVGREEGGPRRALPGGGVRRGSHGRRRGNPSGFADTAGDDRQPSPRDERPAPHGTPTLAWPLPLGLH